MLRFSARKRSAGLRPEGLILRQFLIVPTKKRAKVLLFFELTKYFCKKMHFLVVFLVFANSS
jgi:hypothetical protein